MNTPTSGTIPKADWPFSVESVTQLGGVYYQGIEVGRHLVAARTGGLQVFRRSGDRLAPVSQITLLSTPALNGQGDGRFCATFKTKEVVFSVGPRGRLAILETRPRGGRKARTVAKGPRTLQVGRLSYALGGANEGIAVRGPGADRPNVTLESYSRPSSIHLLESGLEALVCDVGALRLFRIGHGALSPAGGYFAFGWPKDVVIDGGNVFCAHVYGVKWYQKTSKYPWLETVCELSKPHFRIAKLLNLGSHLIACDEVRGLHFLEAQQRRLVPCGGFFLPGGAWSCTFDRSTLYVASGEAGWFEMPFDWSGWRYGALKAHRGWGRVHKVLPWGPAGHVAALSSRGIQLLYQGRATNKKGTTHQSPVGACWDAVSIGGFLVVAASSRGVLVLSKTAAGRMQVTSALETVEARVVSHDGRWLWVGDGKGGVRCCHFNPSTGDIGLAGIYPVPGFVRGLCTAQDEIYVAAGDGGLTMLRRENRHTT